MWARREQNWVPSPASKKLNDNGLEICRQVRGNKHSFIHSFTKLCSYLVDKIQTCWLHLGVQWPWPSELSGSQETFSYGISIWAEIKGWVRKVGVNRQLEGLAWAEPLWQRKRCFEGAKEVLGKEHGIMETFSFCLVEAAQWWQHLWNLEPQRYCLYLRELWEAACKLVVLWVELSALTQGYAI